MRWRCCGNASIRSWPATKMPTTPTVCATIPCCRSSPIRNWATRSAPSPPSAAGRTLPRDAIWCAATTCCVSSHPPLRPAGPPARRDPARPRFHRRSHPRPAATQLLQRRLRPAHVSPHAGLRAPHRMPAGGAPASRKRLQSCPHRAHAAAPGAVSAVRLQAARRRRFRSAAALRVLRVLRYRVRHRHPRQLRLPASCRTPAEAVKAPLPPYPSAAAPLLQLPPPRPQLVPSAPHRLQGRAHRRRNQPALPGDQRRRSNLRAVRFLQRSRRVREPHRGVQERLARRPPELPPLPGQRLPPAPALRRLQPGQPVPSAVAAALALGADRNPARPTLQNRRPRSPDRPLHPLPPRQRLALPEPVPLCRLRRQQRLTRVLIPELTFHPQLLRSRAQNLSARHLYPLGPHPLVLLTPLIAQSTPTTTLSNQNPSPHELSRLGAC